MSSLASGEPKRNVTRGGSVETNTYLWECVACSMEQVIVRIQICAHTYILVGNNLKHGIHEPYHTYIHLYMSMVGAQSARQPTEVNLN
jgi:hypothetical protein